MAEEKRKPSSSRRFRVGYALAPKKRRSFIRPSLLSVASSRGIDLVPIDPLLDLQLQGPFDLILHKLPSDPLWRSHLLSFSSSHPDVPVVDPPSAIDRLRNRVSMLQVVSHLTSTPSPSFGVPRQVVAHSRDALAAPLNPSLHFPLIAKPLVSDGSEKSHKMTLVFSRDALLKLKPPVVLQEFVNHGGVIFKVFVAGDHVKCVRRRSLPDVSEDELNWTECSVSFSQISSSKAAAEETPQQQLLEDVEMPPIEFLTDLAAGLRRVLELRLFNFDVIRDVKAGNHYLVVDINYFPGYAKMPSYESFLTDFLCDVLCGDSDERFGGTDGEKNASG